MPPKLGSIVNTGNDGYRMHGSHWGAFEVRAHEGKIVDVRPFDKDPSPSGILGAIAEAVHHECRVKKPAVREGWLHRRDRKGRGSDRFVEVEWDEALDLVAQELVRVKAAHGNEAIFAGSYGWSSAGRFHHAKTQLQRFMNCFGGYTGQKHNYSLAAGLAILPHIVGDHRPLKALSTWDGIAEHTELFVAFGGVGIRNAQVEPGGTGAHSAETWLKQMRQNGVEIVSITPLRDDTPDELGAEWLAPRPNTDVAMMAGLAHTVLVENLHSRDFLDRYTVGFDQFEAYLTGRDDGIAKDADWAASICQIPAETLRALVRRMAARRTMIGTAYALQRGDHGEQTFWMTMTLGCMLGQVGLPGGGFGFGYGSMHGQGNPAPSWTVPSHSAGHNATESFIPVARIIDLLLNPGKTYEFDGETRTFPETKLIYWCGGNPFHHHQDVNRLMLGWQQPDTVIVDEPFWIPTAKRADIVLPATTTLERNDLGASSKDRFLIAMQQAVPPQGEARNDFDIFRELAHKVGIEADFTQGRDEAAWLKALYDEARDANASAGLEMPEFDDFWQNGYYEVQLPDRPRTVYEDLRADPDANPLPTPSGKFEIFSETISGFGYADCPGHAIWIEPAEWLGSEANDGTELHLISNQPRKRLHSQFDFAGESRSDKINGREVVRLSPSDARARGLADGMLAELSNNRGRALAIVEISDAVADGIAHLPTGAWFDPDAHSMVEKHGNPNVLTLDKGTSQLGQGPIAHTTLVKIAQYLGPANVPTPFSIPVGV